MPKLQNLHGLSRTPKVEKVTNTVQVDPANVPELHSFDLDSNVGLMGQKVEGSCQFLVEGIRRLRPILFPPSAYLSELPFGPAEDYVREPCRQRWLRSSRRTSSPSTKSPASASARASRREASSSGLSLTVPVGPGARTVTVMPFSSGSPSGSRTILPATTVPVEVLMTKC